MSKQKFTLHYFNGRGAGEGARWLLALSEADWTDKRYTGEDWPAFKPNTPYGQMPVLEMDDVMICQSNAIASYIAEIFGYLGSNAMERAEINMIVGCQGDCQAAFYRNAYFNDEGEKERLMKEFINDALPKYCNFIEKKLVGGKSYLVGEKLSYADISAVVWLDNLEKRGVFDTAKDYPALADLMERVRSVPKIAEWIAERPDSTF